MEMLLTGEPISAQQALEWGLVNRVVPAEQLDAEVQKLATTFPIPMEGLEELKGTGRWQRS